MLVAGKALNIFLLTGILNINIFFIIKKNDVVVNGNIYDNSLLKNPDLKSKKYFFF
jgi:hypothetical protein